jgi:hypothetical protein
VAGRGHGAASASGGSLDDERLHSTGEGGRQLGGEAARLRVASLGRKRGVTDRVVEFLDDLLQAVQGLRRDLLRLTWQRAGSTRPGDEPLNLAGRDQGPPEKVGGLVRVARPQRHLAKQLGEVFAAPSRTQPCQASLLCGPVVPADAVLLRPNGRVDVRDLGYWRCSGTAVKTADIVAPADCSRLVNRTLMTSIVLELEDLPVRLDHRRGEGLPGESPVGVVGAGGVAALAPVQALRVDRAAVGPGAGTSVPS